MIKWGSNILLSALLLSRLLSAAPNPNNNPEGPKGYFWYQEAPKESKAPEKEPQRLQPIMPSQAEMMAMHPKAIRALLDEHREYAIHTLQPSDVLNYQKIQDVARKKADAFAAVSSLVLMQNPKLNAQIAVPTTNPGMAAQRQQVDHAVEKTLQHAGSQFALAIFTIPNCRYCTILKQTLMQFHQGHGWRIKEIDVLTHQQLVKKFNIEFTPTVLFIKKDTPDWMPVSVGAEALSTIEQNIYRAVRLIRGEIKPQQFFMDKHEQGGFADPLSGASS